MSKYIWKNTPCHEQALAAIREHLYNQYACDAVAETTESAAGLRVDVLVCDKHFFRVGNRVSLTVIVATSRESTRVTAIGSGGSASLLSRFDWGAEEDFASELERTLAPMGFREG